MSAIQRRRWAAVCAALALVAVGCGRDSESSSSDGSSSSGSDSSASTKAFIDPESDCDGTYDATKGIEGDTITLGTVRPASGAYSLYDSLTKGMEKFFDAANAKGGIKAGDGKQYKINLVKGDDGYDPSRTPGVVKQLVESDGVFALVGDVGTETNLAVRDYLNEQCVPSVSLATGSTEWGDAAKYPWYISGLPSYATEINGFLDYITSVQPDATIAVLKQSDDLGSGYADAITKYIKDNDSKLSVVAEESFDVTSGATTESATVKLAASKADVFIVALGGTPCPTTLRFLPSDWTPKTYVSLLCSVKLAMSLAGDGAQGVFSSQATLDAGDPKDQSNERIQQFFTDGASVGLSESDMTGGVIAAGWGFASNFAAILGATKDVTRAGLMNAAFSLDLGEYGLLRDGATVKTNGAKDPWMLESIRVVQREGDSWTEVAPLTDYNGKSNGFAG